MHTDEVTAFLQNYKGACDATLQHLATLWAGFLPFDSSDQSSQLTLNKKVNIELFL